MIFFFLIYKMASVFLMHGGHGTGVALSVVEKFLNGTGSYT